jgi:hypothetical protein
MFCRPCFNRFWGLKYIPRLFSEYMLTFRVEEPWCCVVYQGCNIIFNVGTSSVEARNIRLVNIITYIIEESKLISENMQY